jgi:RNA polymerase sigma-70 factor (ECF subfamily)
VQTDEELMLAYQQGDVEAFATLVTRHERPLWRFVRRFVQEDAAAADLLQDVFVRLVDASSAWQPRAKLTTWMYTIARNLCTDHARKQRHRRTVPLDTPAAGGDPEGSGPLLVERVADGVDGANGERRTLETETGRHIERALALLPEEQREVFLMREVLQLPFAEIAVAIGVAEPTVKSRMRYALLRLRESLAELAPASVQRAAAAGGEGLLP